MLRARACLLATVSLSVLVHACSTRRPTEPADSEENELSDIPNDVRNAVYELPDLEDVVLRHGLFAIRAKVDPYQRTPRFAYRLPAGMSPEEILDQILAPHLGPDFGF